MYMRFSSFCDVTQCRLVSTDVLGEPLGPIFRGPSNPRGIVLELLDPRRGNLVGCPEMITDLRCVTWQKSKDLVYHLLSCSERPNFTHRVYTTVLWIPRIKNIAQTPVVMCVRTSWLPLPLLIRV